MHTDANIAGGMPCQKSGALRFFVTQFAGVALEDAVQQCYRRIGGRSGDWRVRVVGFVWVFAFLCGRRLRGSIPVWQSMGRRIALCHSA